MQNIVTLNYIFSLGSVAEWFKVPLSKSGIRETVSGVRILSLPQNNNREDLNSDANPLTFAKLK